MNENDATDLRMIAKGLEAGGMRCNCDLDNWQPEGSTSHSHVCRIHRKTLEVANEIRSQTKWP